MDRDEGASRRRTGKKLRKCAMAGTSASTPRPEVLAELALPFGAAQITDNYGNDRCHRPAIFPPFQERQLTDYTSQSEKIDKDRNRSSPPKSGRSMATVATVKDRSQMRANFSLGSKQRLQFGSFDGSYRVSTRHLLDDAVGRQRAINGRSKCAEGLRKADSESRCTAVPPQPPISRNDV
jgi:hypothetical protein